MGIFPGISWGTISKYFGNVPDFYEIWHSEQIKHANHEYVNWNWLRDSKLKIWEICPKTEMWSNFYEMWHLEQIEHVNYEYSTWNSSKFVSSTEICSDIYEIWHSQQIEHGYYEYNHGNVKTQGITTTRTFL